MRYKKVQIFHNVVVDDEIKSIETARSLFKNLSESNMDVSIKYTLPSAEDEVILRKTRIESVGEESIDIVVFFTGGIARDKIKIKNINFVGIVTDRSNIIFNKDEITGYDFLDLSDDENN